VASDLQLAYREARAGAGGRGHFAALRHLEKTTGIDAATIARVLDRAALLDQRDPPAPNN
jgi:hypothetical protein